jgi:hypothetical protein
MSTPREVANVLKHLQGVKAFGHELSFRPSKEKL